MEEPKISKDLLSIPGEVIYDNIFPYFGLNDLLRLRRVCKQLQTNSNDYIGNHFCDQEREINTTNHTFADFIQLDIPASSIYLSNNGPTFFEDPNISEFLRLYASKITHLRVKHFGTCISEPENNFFVALQNLENLELEHIDARERHFENGEQCHCYFPPNFKNLKTLKLGRIQESAGLYPNYSCNLIKFCTNLEYLQHPFLNNYFKDLREVEYGFSPNDSLIACVVSNLQQKIKQNLPISLKYYDLKNLDDQNLFYCDSIVSLLEISLKNDIKLLNFEAELCDHFAFVKFQLLFLFQKYKSSLLSVKNLKFGTFLTELPNLEKLVIESTKNSFYGEVWRQRPQWPKLKSLDITIDSDETRNYNDYDLPALHVTELFSFLFTSVERKELKELAIRFDKEIVTRNALPCPIVRNIVFSCENVTKLTLSNWLGTDDAVSLFWNGLPCLEEVVIDQCKLLGNAAFLGDWNDEPAFLMLTKLRKLKLFGLDTMTRINDDAFDLVFRHLKIKEFVLTSREPIKSVTINGIGSLLNGEFNQNVEKFRFQDWSLDNVSEEEYLQLKMDFRASYML